MRVVVAIISISLLSVVSLATEQTPFDDGRFVMTLDVVPGDPKPGERVYFLGRVRNATGRTLHVPADLRSWLHLQAHHSAPREDRAHAGVARGMLANPPPITWIPLEPGDAIELGGDVAEYEARCRRGCPEGTISLVFSLDTPIPERTEGEAGDHVVPEAFQISRTLTLARPAPVVLERTDPGAVRVKALGARIVGRDVVMRVRFENTTTAPMWMRKPDSLEVVACSIEGPEGGGGWARGSGRPSRKAARRADYVLLQPGRGVAGTLRCGDLLGEGRGSVTISWESTSPAEYSSGFDPPFVWSGRGEIGPVPIR